MAFFTDDFGALFPVAFRGGVPDKAALMLATQNCAFYSSEAYSDPHPGAFAEYMSQSTITVRYARNAFVSTDVANRPGTLIENGAFTGILEISAIEAVNPHMTTSSSKSASVDVVFSAGLSSVSLSVPLLKESDGEEIRQTSPIIALLIRQRHIRSDFDGMLHVNCNVVESPNVPGVDAKVIFTQPYATTLEALTQSSQTVPCSFEFGNGTHLFFTTRYTRWTPTTDAYEIERALAPAPTTTDSLSQLRVTDSNLGSALLYDAVRQVRNSMREEDPDELLFDLEPFAFVESHETHTQVWIYADHAQRRLLITFRGTEGPGPDYCTDVMDSPRSLGEIAADTYVLQPGEGLAVERANDAHTEAWEQLASVVSESRNDVSAKFSAVFSGAVAATDAAAQSAGRFVAFFAAQSGAVRAATTSARDAAKQTIDAAVDGALDASLLAAAVANIRVHGGIRESYASVREALLQVVYDITGWDDQWRLWITGHSLGGGLSTLCTFEFCNRLRGGSRPQVAQMSFGSLRVGNEAFVRAFNRTCACAYRIAYVMDQFPDVHPHFVHGGKSVVFSNGAERGNGITVEGRPLRQFDPSYFQDAEQHVSTEDAPSFTKLFTDSTEIEHHGFDTYFLLVSAALDPLLYADGKRDALANGHAQKIA